MDLSPSNSPQVPCKIAYDFELQLEAKVPNYYSAVILCLSSNRAGFCHGYRTGHHSPVSSMQLYSTDSPLSITGDLTGILTLALAIWASIVYCYRSFRDFESELGEMQHRVQLAFEETARIRRAFIERPRMSPLHHHHLSAAETGGGDTEPHVWNETPANYLIDEAWNRAEREMIKATKFVNKRLLKPNTVLGVLRSKTAYVMERKKAAETVARLERALEHLKGILADASGQCVIPTPPPSRLLILSLCSLISL